MPIFGAAQLEKVIHDTLPTELPAGHTYALVGMVDKYGARIVTSFKKDVGNHSWEVQGAVWHDWGGDTTAAGKVIFSM